MLFDRITNAPHVPRAKAFLDARAMVRNPVRVFEKYRQRFGPTFTVHLTPRQKWCNVRSILRSLSFARSLAERKSIGAL